MGWDVKEEQLVVVGENARAIKYTINGTMLSTHNLNAHEVSTYIASQLFSALSLHFPSAQSCK